jgi:transposase
MIPAGVAVYVAVEPVDMRFGFERLSALVRERVGYEARSGALFVFFAKRRHALKAIFADATGLCMFYKRLDRGTFVIPEPDGPDARYIEIDEAALDALLDGITIDEGRKSRRKVRGFH